MEPEKALSKPVAASQQAWPASLPEQVRAVAQLLSQSAVPLTLASMQASFKGRGQWKKGLPTLLQTLEALGRAHSLETPEGTAWRS